jgi:hypothetical protein
MPTLHLDIERSFQFGTNNTKDADTAFGHRKVVLHSKYDILIDDEATHRYLYGTVLEDFGDLLDIHP